MWKVIDEKCDFFSFLQMCAHYKLNSGHTYGGYFYRVITEP